MTQPQSTTGAAAGPVAGQDLDAAVRLAYEWGELKRLPRRGWLRAWSAVAPVRL